MKARWVVALMGMALVVVALAGVSGASAGIADSPISPVETPHPGVPTGFTPTPVATIGTAPDPVATQVVRSTPEPAPTETPVMLLPDTGAELES